MKPEAVVRTLPVVTLESPTGRRITHVTQSLGLHPVAADILAEVCRMKEFGNRHQCDASNGHFHKATGCHPVTASKHLKALNTVGWVSFPITKSRGRVIHPAPLLEEIYQTEDEPILSRSLAILSRILSQTPAILSRSLAGTLAEAEAILSQTGSETESAKDAAKQTIRTSTEHPIESNNDSSLVGELTEKLNAALAAVEAGQSEIVVWKDLAFTWENTAKATAADLLAETELRQAVEVGREQDREAARRVVAGRDKTIADLKARLAPAKTPPRQFQPPTQEEVFAYMREKRPHNPRPDVQRLATRYMGHYSGNGWKVGRNPMKDWKGACLTFLADLPAIAPPVAEPSTPIAERTANGNTSEQQREMLRQKNANLNSIR